MNAAVLALALVLLVAAVIVKESRRLSVAEAAAIVDQVNAELGNRLDRYDVLAVIEVESARDPQAFRFEAHINDASRGLMQVLLSTARDRGYAGEPEGLFDPLTNVRIGMSHLLWGYDFLASRFGRAPTAGEWIGAYNAGVGNVLGGFIPQGYVEKWAAARATISGAGFG